MNRYIRIISGWLFLLSLSAFPLRAQVTQYPGDPKFAAGAIPAHLSDGADAVVRINQLHFEATAPDRGRTRIRRVVTVLKPEGRDHGSLSVWYDSFRRIRSFNAELLDASGNRVRRIRNNEFQDLSLISGYSLYEDSRERVLDVRHDAYPYTVVFEYEIDHRGLINWPTWYPLDSEAPVEWGQLVIIAPHTLPVRHHVRGDLSDPDIARDGRTMTYSWTVNGVEYEKPEPLGPPMWAQYPSISVAPTQFEIGGRSGRMDSWEAFGQWYHELSRDRSALTPEVQAAVAEMKEAADSDRDLVRAIYEFLQRSTRYVNVSLGIGGWQPFDAKYVIDRGYGDCKALTNYLHALLHEAGIEAFPALIRSERYPGRTIPSFPSNQFNHVILMVPLAATADTVWLEATSQTIPFGHVGAANENRWALVVRDGGSELVRTPASAAERNSQFREGSVTVHPDGAAEAAMVTRYQGNQQDRMRSLATASATDRDRWIHSALGIRDYRISRVDFDALLIRSDEVSLPVEVALPRFASRMGNRLVFEPNLAERWRTVPARAEHRKHELVISSYPYIDHDRLEYRIPDGYRVEALAPPVILDADFGRFEMTVDVSESGLLVFERTLEIRDSILPASSFESYREFAEAVVRADAARVVLVAE
jgi:hypothetical protein